MTTSRFWPISIIISGALWVFFSMAPTPVTTVLGVPFMLYTFIGGWLIRRRSVRLNDPAGAKQAVWGMGIGCFGCVWQIIALTILSLLGVTVIATGITELLKQWPATPIP
jgi:hypothetical protein